MYSSNGSGKSSIFQQIIYGLGFSTRIPKSLVNISKKKGRIEIDLVNSQTNTHYKIRREIYRSNTPSTLEVFKNGIQIDFQRNDSFDTILRNEILGMDVDIYRRLRIFLPENELLLQTGGQELLRFLERILDIEKFDIYYQKQNKYLMDNKNKIRELEIHIEHEKTEIDKLKKNVLKFQNLEQVLQQIEQKKKELEGIDYSEDKEKELIEKIKNNEQKIGEINQKINMFKINIRNGEKEIKRLNYLKKGSRCPVCFTTIEGNENVLNEIEKMIKMNEEIINKNKELIEVFNEDYKNTTDELNKLKDEYKVMNENKQKIIRLEKHIKELENLKEELLKESKKMIDNEIKKREDLIKKYKEEIKKIEKENVIYEQLQMFLSPKSKIRQKVLTELLLNNLKSYMEYYSSFLFYNEKVDYLLDNNKLYIGLSNEDGLFRDYSLLSSGERKKTEMIFLLSLNELVCMMNKVNFDLFIFDEVFDNLDSDSSSQLMEVLKDFSYRVNQFFMVTTHRNVFDIEKQTILQIEKTITKTNKIENSRLVNVIRT